MGKGSPGVGVSSLKEVQIVRLVLMYQVRLSIFTAGFA